MIASILAVAAIALYLYGVRCYRNRRGKSWPNLRTAAFLCGVASGIGAIAAPLDELADSRFSAHMLQHLLLTDVTAPLLLFGGPLLLLLTSLEHGAAKRAVRILRSAPMRFIAHPLVAWTLFIITLWTIHFTVFFDAALEHESLHYLEHALFVGTALLFWLPVIAVGPTPWVEGPLSYPIRLLYVLIAMPAEGLLGFAIYGATHVMHRHYAAAGLGDQQIAGEMMWIGSGVIMFLAFMMIAAEWANAEQRAGLRFDERAGHAHE